MITLDFRVYGVHPLEMRNSAIVGDCVFRWRVSRKEKKILITFLNLHLLSKQKGENNRMTGLETMNAAHF